MSRILMAVLMAFLLAGGSPPLPVSAGGYVYNAKGDKIYVGDYVPETPQAAGEANASGDQQVAQQLQGLIQRFIASQYRNVGGLADVYATCIIKAAKAYNVDPLLLASMVAQESSFNPNAVSPAGALGPAQLMPETARRLGVSNSFDIEQAMCGAARYIAEMLVTFEGENQVALALAAYNAGPEAVRKYRGIPPFPETTDYVAQVARNYTMLCNQ